MALQIIKTRTVYNEALKRLSELLDIDPEVGSLEFKELEVLSLLLEEYEKITFPIDLPDPIEAIKFRMDQMGLAARDLVPMIGSRSKVSEVLAKKRPLSLRMIRALHSQLGISAEVLLHQEDATIPDESEIQWSRFPIREMNNRKWFGNIIPLATLKDQTEEFIRPLIETLIKYCSNPALPRMSTRNFRLRDDVDIYALVAWQAKLVEIAVNSPLPDKYPHSTDESLLFQVVQQSLFDDGPLLAKELLNKKGIHLILQKHLDRTYLDGAALLLNDGTPVIGLTLRYDRLDNFWFTLLHELAHLVKHLQSASQPIFDDLETKGKDFSKIEKEADKLAEEALLPNWKKEDSANAEKFYSLEQLRLEARNRNRDVAILAGRIQHDTKNYQKYRKLLGNKVPSKKFTIN